MYVYKRQVSAHRGIATLLVLALVFWALGVHMFSQPAEAANFTNVSDTLTDSHSARNSVHTVAFTSPNGMLANSVFTIDFPAQFNIGSLVIGDIAMTVGGNATTVAATNGADQWGVVVGGNNSIEFTVPNDDPVASSTAFSIVLGDEAGTMITNPSATTSYEISIGETPQSASTTIQDGGYARVAIIDNVLVTAEVDTTLEFTIEGTATGTTVNGSPTTTDGLSTNNTLPFNTLAAGTSKTLAQDLTVTTNAANGFVVTVEQSQQLQSSTGADIDGFVNGSWTTTPTAWQGPSNQIADEDTWGHWGLTSEDGTTTRAAEFTSDTWVAASTTPIVVMSHDDPADGVTQGIGTARVGYQIQITALQEAGDDYNTTLTYIATPTF